jgi:hypothetical protein
MEFCGCDVPPGTRYRPQRYGGVPANATLQLIAAIPIFISLANKAVHENAEAIRHSFGR